MTKGVCSVCNAQPEVLEAVNAAIRAKEKFRDLAARTAFSRAALHRHASKCIPRHILTRDRELKTTEGSKIITQTPVPGRPGFFHLTTIETDRFGRSQLRYLTPEDVPNELPNCVLQRVTYDEPLPVTPEENSDTEEIPDSASKAENAS